MRTPLSYDLRMKGPVPITASGWLKSLNLSSASRGRIAQNDGLARWFRNGAYGSFSVMRTVWRAIAAVALTRSEGGGEARFGLERSGGEFTLSAATPRAFPRGLVGERTTLRRLEGE